MLSFLPPWKSVEKHGITKRLMANEQTLLERESMGSTSENGAPLIEPRLVKSFKEKPFYSVPQKQTVPWVMIAFDPNTSDTPGSSESAIVSMYIHQGTHVVSLSIWIYIFNRECWWWTWWFVAVFLFLAALLLVLAICGVVGVAVLAHIHVQLA